MKKETFKKLDSFIVTLFSTMAMFIFFASFWVVLEEVIYGEAQNHIVDNIVCIPVIYSFYCNVKHTLNK